MKQSEHNFSDSVLTYHDNIKYVLEATAKLAVSGSLSKMLITVSFEQPFSSTITTVYSPGKQFINQMDQLQQQIKQHYPAYDLFVCGSRRTPKKFHLQIRELFKQAQLCWLDESDGKNPYLGLLANSDVLMVTSDSINMLSEACATDKTVIALARNDVSPKHKRFVESMQGRLSEFGTRHSNPVPVDALTHVAQQVILLLKNGP